LGRADLRFLERSFQGLMLNFNWWVNRKDPEGKNVFAGGFLGLDNIGCSTAVPTPDRRSPRSGDGTAWMAFYCQNMLEIALILTDYDSMYETLLTALSNILSGSLTPWTAWREPRRDVGQQEGFFYDLPISRTAMQCG